MGSCCCGSSDPDELTHRPEPISFNTSVKTEDPGEPGRTKKAVKTPANKIHKTSYSSNSSAQEKKISAKYANKLTRMSDKIGIMQSGFKYDIEVTKITSDSDSGPDLRELCEGKKVMPRLLPSRL